MHRDGSPRRATLKWCAAVPRSPRHSSCITTLQISSDASFRLRRRLSPPANLESGEPAAGGAIESTPQRRMVRRFLPQQSENDYVFATTGVSARSLYCDTAI